MLNVDHLPSSPAYCAQMVDFLLQDNVCENLVEFITQNGHVGTRPGPNEQHGEAMKLAYRYVPLFVPRLSVSGHHFICVTERLFYYLLKLSRIL